MASHLPVDMTPRSIACSCGRVLRLSAADCSGLSKAVIDNMLLDRHSDHVVSMQEQQR